MENVKLIRFAVKALILNGNKFLAMRRSAEKSPKFELPGGGMEFGETAEETVIREVFEETGLTVAPVKLVDTWNYVTQTLQITGIIYLCVAENPNNVILSAEHDRYEWMDANAESFEKINRLFRPQMLKWDWNELFVMAERK
ncbi:MAG: NUDIX domain-containing protein [Treponema sp.]|nr:NUDIX domain-containing protein [Treponema sp.]